MTTTPTTMLSIAPPPTEANIPTPPTTAGEPTGAIDYRGVQPKSAEQAALRPALADLQRFTDYAQALSSAAPPVAHVVALLTLAVEWTGMSNATSAWATYCKTQEGLVWAQLRAAMVRLKPAWELAVTADAGLTTQYPGLTSLLRAKKVIALKGVATRRANEKAVVEGRAPLHGNVGRRRKRAAKNAAYAAATSRTP